MWIPCDKSYYNYAWIHGVSDDVYTYCGLTVDTTTSSNDLNKQAVDCIKGGNHWHEVYSLGFSVNIILTLSTFLMMLSYSKRGFYARLSGLLCQCLALFATVAATIVIGVRRLNTVGRFSANSYVDSSYNDKYEYSLQNFLDRKFVDDGTDYNRNGVNIGVLGGLMIVMFGFTSCKFYHITKNLVLDVRDEINEVNV